MPQLASPAALSGDVTSDVSLESSDDLSQLSAMLDADEAADRGNSGQAEGGTEDADDSADPTVAGADQSQEQANGEAGGNADATTADNSGTTAAKPGDQDQQQDGQQQQELTPYQKARQKERARIAKQWKLINEQKLANAQEAARLEARSQALGQNAGRDERGRFTGQPASGNGNANGSVLEYSSEQYLEGADRFTTMAQEAEARGDFAEANRQWELAETAREVAVEAQQAERSGATRQAQAPPDPTNGWAQARQDFPELLDRSSDAHKQFVQFLREHPSVADYPKGPYLAAAFVVSRLAAARTPELQKEAALVPELRKQVDELTAKVKELTRFTRVTPSGNPPNRNDKPAKQFGDLSMAEMEAQLDRELAELRG